MMAEVHEFGLTTHLHGDSDGDGKVQFDWGGDLEYGLPIGTGGKPGRSNPEEMLIAAASSCYSLTLAALYERRGIPIRRITVKGEGTMSRQPDQSLKFESLSIRPRIETDFLSESQRTLAIELAHKADVYCVISRAMRGNVEVTVEPELVVA